MTLTPPLRAPRGATRTAKGWIQEAAKRMLLNNLDPEVAERPEELIVYGGRGKAARSWQELTRLVATLERLENDQTLLVQSGKAVGVFKTFPLAPRVIIANSNLVPAWATWAEFDRLEHELKMLRVIKRLRQEGPQRITATLLVHVVPSSVKRDAYLEMVTAELIPEVANTGLAEAVDLFIDRGAFSVAEARRLFGAARRHGLAIKGHAEQLTHTGATRLICELGGLSADHLEQATEQDWQALAASGTVGTLLPGAALLLRQPLPNARALWDRGVQVAVATDHNPGSSPLFSLLLALQLTVALGGLSVEEALIAGTRHAAEALGQVSWGRLTPGAVADFVVVDGPQALTPLYYWGHAPIFAVYVAGRPVMTAR